MDLDSFIVAVFCLVDEAIPRVTAGRRLRDEAPRHSWPTVRC